MHNTIVFLPIRQIGASKPEDSPFPYSLGGVCLSAPREKKDCISWEDLIFLCSL